MGEVVKKILSKGKSISFDVSEYGGALFNFDFLQLHVSEILRDVAGGAASDGDAADDADQGVVRHIFNFGLLRAPEPLLNAFQQSGVVGVVRRFQD